MDLEKHPDPYVTTSDLAGYWRVSRKQIYKQIDAGTLRAIRLGPRLLRISTAEAIRFEHLAKMLPMAEGRLKSHAANRVGGSGEEGAAFSPNSPRAASADGVPPDDEKKRPTDQE